MEAMMRIFKIKKEEDLKKIEEKRIKPIKIMKTGEGWDVEVEEDVNIDEIIRPQITVPISKKETKKEVKKDKKKKKK